LSLAGRINPDRAAVSPRRTTGLLRDKIQVRYPTRGKRMGVTFTKSCQRIVPISAKSKAAAVPAAGKQL